MKNIWIKWTKNLQILVEDYVNMKRWQNW